MARAVAQRPLVFQHIPKTAGVSLRSVISCNFHADDILHVQDDHWRDRRLAVRAARRYRFIHGHVHYDFVSAIIGSTDVITFLRHPVERVLSLYFYLRAQAITPELTAGARRAIEQAQRLPIEEFAMLRRPGVGAMITNYQVQMFLRNAQVLGQSDRTWVATALDNLEAYRFVGIADPDLMSQSVAAMSRVFGWVPSGDAPRVNQTSRSKTAAQLASATRIIVERNKLDMEFYERVRARLEAALRPSRTRQAREPSALKAEVARYRTGLTSPVTMDQPLRCWGWHDREFSEGKCWRCAAQLRSGLDLRVPTDSRIALLLTLKSAHPRIALENTTLEARGRTLRSRILLIDNRPLIAVLVGPRDVDKNGILSLVISCKESEPGAAPAPGTTAKAVPDSRFVAFALESIDIVTQSGAGAAMLDLLVNLLSEPAHLYAMARGLEIERSARGAEQAQAAQYAASLTERAERSEAYSASLAEELKKLKEETAKILSEVRATSAARASEQESAAREFALLIERAKRSEVYSASMQAELAKFKEEHDKIRTAREHERGTAEQQHRALAERAQRAEEYCATLAAELSKLREAHEVVCVARERERAGTEQQCNALTERAQRSETYCESLQTELARVRREYQEALAGFERVRVASEQEHRALTERAQRSETYCESLQTELARVSREYQESLAGFERVRVASEQEHRALTERAQLSEQYCQSLLSELDARRNETPPAQPEAADHKPS